MNSTSLKDNSLLEVLNRVKEYYSNKNIYEQSSSTLDQDFSIIEKALKVFQLISIINKTDHYFRLKQEKNFGSVQSSYCLYTDKKEYNLDKEMYDILKELIK